MKRRALAGLIAFALLLGAQTSFGAGTEGELTALAEANAPVTQEDLNGVRTEIETLREQWSRGYEKKTANTTRPLLFSGIVQTRFTATEDDTPANTTPGGFDLAALIVGFSGNLKRDYEEGRNVNYQFSLISPSGANDFTVKPLEASITAFILPSLLRDQPLLSVTLGQQKKPFGLEALATEEKKPTIKSSQATIKLGLDPRDIGIVVKGDINPEVDFGYNYRVPLIEYSFGLVNGSGPNASDNNTEKDYVGRVVLNATNEYTSPLRGLSLGASYYNGTPLLKSSAATPVTANGKKIFKEVDLSYVNTPVGFTLEYVVAHVDALATPADINSKRSIESKGITFTLFYNFGEQFLRGYKGQDRYDDWYPLTYQPFVRFDRFDPNTDKTGDRQDIYTIGFNWFFAETTKLQLNYNIRKEEAHGKDDNEFLAQFQFGF